MNPMIIHSQKLTFEMKFHADGHADCIVGLASTDKRELDYIHSRPEQYMITVMPIITAAIAGICRHYKNVPGCSIEELIQQIVPSLEHAYYKSITKTKIERLVDPEEN